MKRTLLLTLPALLLAGCTAASESTQTDALAIESRYPLDYAQQFTVDECAGGYSLITIDGSRYLVALYRADRFSGTLRVPERLAELQ